MKTLLLLVPLLLSCGTSIVSMDPLEPSQLVRAPDGTIRYHRPSWCAPCAPCDCTCADPVGTNPRTEHVLVGAAIVPGQNSDTSPQFRATFTTPFWMARHELTVRCVELCRRAGACTPFTLDPEFQPSVQLPERADFASRGLTKLDAQQACRFFGGDLPTSAQWEFTARGTDGRLLPWGTEAFCDGGDYDIIYRTEPPGYVRCAPPATRRPEEAVGSFPRGAGPYGTLDLAGGVAEWVSDFAVGRVWYQSMANVNNGGSEPLDPTGSLTATADTPEFYQHGVLRGPTSIANGMIGVFYGTAPSDHSPSVGARCRWTSAPGL